jgi:hypothetical protein
MFAISSSSIPNFSIHLNRIILRLLFEWDSIGCGGEGGGGFNFDSKDRFVLHILSNDAG